MDDKTTLEEAKARYDVCKSCEFFIKPTRQCQLCLCVMSMKVHLKDATCPEKKW